MNNLLEQNRADINSLQQRMEENSIKSRFCLRYYQFFPVDHIQNTVTQQAERFDCKVESIINHIKGETVGYSIIWKAWL